jgi:uncharacterized membrane protein YoaT (DUF817 family)
MISASSFFSHTFIGDADTIRFFLAVVAVGVFAKNPMVNRQKTNAFLQQCKQKSDELVLKGSKRL